MTLKIVIKLQRRAQKKKAQKRQNNQKKSTKWQKGMLSIPIQLLQL